MAKICYGVAGEGRGHATRTRAMVEMLRREHEVTIFASHHAYAMLSAAYAGTEVEVVSIPGLRHGYGRGGRLSLLGSLVGALPFLLRLPGLLDRLTETVAKRSPDLIITDFEPLLPRVAKRLGVPFVSIDHQHFLVNFDLSVLPPHLYRASKVLSLVVRLFYSGQALTVISSFFSLPLKPSSQQVTKVGVLLRPEMTKVAVRDGEYLVAYFRRGACRAVLRALAQCGREVRIYGAGERLSQGKMVFRPLSEGGFIADLASAAGLITTAGNQVVGEAVALGKPVLALPEPGNLEQEMNGFFVQHTGAGRTAKFCELNARIVRDFLAELPELRAGLERLPRKGNEAALEAVERFLAACPPPRPLGRGGVLIPQQVLAPTLR